jgi:hypothetical protein
LVVRELSLRFIQPCAGRFYLGWLCILVALQLAQIGAGEGDFGLELSLAIIDAWLAGAYQFRRRLLRGVFCGMQSLLGCGQCVTQATELCLVCTGFLCLLEFGAFHRQLDLGFLQRFVIGRFGGGSGCSTLRGGQGLLGFVQLLAQAGEFGLLVVVR